MKKHPNFLNQIKINSNIITNFYFLHKNKFLIECKIINFRVKEYIKQDNNNNNNILTDLQAIMIGFRL